MALSLNSPPVVTPELTFAALPAADANPLEDVVQNANGMYASHAPPLLEVIYTVAQNIAGRSAVFWLPVLPSVDALVYDFTHKIWTGTGAGTLTVQVEEWTGAAWGPIRTTAGIAAPATSSITHNHSDVISASATMLRITISRASVDPFTPDSILVRPGTQTLAVGVKTSGAVLYDDGLLGLTVGAPITTEHLNRGPATAAAILADRRQCVMAFAQEIDPTNAVYHRSDSSLSDGLFARFGRAMCSIPGQRDPTIDVLVIASVDAGGTADLVRVMQHGKTGVLLDASGGVEAGQLTLAMIAPGEITARAVLELEAKNTAVGNECTIHAAIGLWSPGA